VRCGHAADASLAPTDSHDIVLLPRRVPRSLKEGLCGLLVSSVLVLMPGLLGRLLDGAGAGRRPCSA
jgi:hypothetical protein